MSLHKLIRARIDSAARPEPITSNSNSVTGSSASHLHSQESTTSLSCIKSPNPNKSANKSRSRSPQAKAIHHSTGRHGEEKHSDAHSGASANDRARGIGNDVCARCLRHDEKSVGAHTSAEECPHAQCLDCEHFERRNRHTHTRHVLRNWLQRGRPQAAFEKPLEAADARASSADVGADKNEKTRGGRSHAHDRSDSSDSSDSAAGSKGSDGRAEREFEEPTASVNANRTHEPPEELPSGRTAHQQSKSLNQSSSSVVSVREEHSNSDTGITSASSEDYQDGVPDIIQQSQRSSSEQQRQQQQQQQQQRQQQQQQQEDNRKTLYESLVRDAQLAITMPSQMQAATLSVLTQQMRNQLALSMLNLVPGALNPTGPHRPLGPLALPEYPYVPISLESVREAMVHSLAAAAANTAPPRLPSPPPLYRFRVGDGETARAERPALLPGPSGTSPTPPSRNKREEHYKSLSSGPIQAPPSTQPPAPPVAPRGTPVSASNRTPPPQLVTSPHNPERAALNSVAGRHWSRQMMSTAMPGLIERDGRAPVGLEAVPPMWLSGHPSPSSQRYLYYCLPYAEVQQQQQRALGAPRPLPLPGALPAPKIVGGAAPRTSPPLPVSTIHKETKSSNSNATPVVILDDDSDNEGPLRALNVAVSDRGEREASARASSASSFTLLDSTSVAITTSTSTRPNMKRAHFGAQSSEVPVSKSARGNVAPSPFEPLSPLSSASTAQERFQTGSNVASTRIPCSCAAHCAASNGSVTQTSGNVPAIAANYSYISPRLANIFGIRGNGPNVPASTSTFPQTTPLPNSTYAGTQRSQVPPAINGADPNGTRAAGGEQSKKFASMQQPIPAQLPTQLLPARKGRSTAPNGGPAASASTAEQPVASASKICPPVAPEQIDAYARQLSEEMRARLSSNERMPHSASASTQAANREGQSFEHGVIDGRVHVLLSSFHFTVLI